MLRRGLRVPSWRPAGRAYSVFKDRLRGRVHFVCRHTTPTRVVGTKRAVAAAWAAIRFNKDTVDPASLLLVAQGRRRLGFLERRPVLVVHTEVERVVRDHPQHGEVGDEGASLQTSVADAPCGDAQGRTTAESSACSLSWVSCSSAAGSESFTMPPPANMRARLPCMRADRKPTAHSPLPAASTQPTGPA